MYKQIGAILLLEQLIQLLIQLKTALDENAIAETAAQPPLAAPTPPPKEPVTGLLFNEALRLVSWNGGCHLFSNRKAKRCKCLMFLWDRCGQYVSAEEMTSVFFDSNRYRWPTIRRYMRRLQQDELDLSGCPFRILIEAEGFKLLPVSR